MRRAAKLLAASGLVAALLVSLAGVLVGDRIVWLVSRDVQARRIVHEPVRVCRYLRLTGLVERRRQGEDAAWSRCRWLGAG